MGKRMGVWRVSWLAVAAMEAAAPVPALGTGRWAPDLRHYAAMEQAKDCAVYRAVAAKVEKEQAERRHALAAVEKLLRDRRAELDRCAKDNGITKVTTEDEDRRLAEACPLQYADWLAPGYRFHLLEADVRRGDDDAATLTSVARFRCGGLAQGT